MKTLMTVAALFLAAMLDSTVQADPCLANARNHGGCSPQPAFAVGGAIGDKYHQLGGADGFLGAPTTPERPADFGGRYQEFAHGVIYFFDDPNIGAHEVHGEILALWTQLGRTNFGYPITDETPVAQEGLGRFNHFRLVQLRPAIEDRSIYWTSATHAHAVVGAIRKKWAEWEWERGKLGYPTSEEMQAGDLRKSYFQYGYVTWSNAAGAQVKTYDHSPETMTDRCSGEVSFPPVYGGSPTELGGVVLKRGTNGYSDWTGIFTAGLDGSGHVRWYCHSTAGNFIDPGTWVLRDSGLGCTFSGNGTTTTGNDPNKAGANVSCTTTVNLQSTDTAGWTAEQSRCNDHTNNFRARLGPNRLLETLCVESISSSP
jgi:hypothetical protein